MPRCQLREGVGLPAEDFGDQFLVGFVAQSPPCPSASPATQHNCLLIRTDSPTVTGFRQISARERKSPKFVSLIELCSTRARFTTILYIFLKIFSRSSARR